MSICGGTSAKLPYIATGFSDITQLVYCSAADPLGPVDRHNRGRVRPRVPGGSVDSVRLGDGVLRRRAQIERVVVPSESAATRAREVHQESGDQAPDEASPSFVGRSRDAPRSDMAVELVPVLPVDVVAATGPPETPEDV
jgi:hypothetical protein